MKDQYSNLTLYEANDLAVLRQMDDILSCSLSELLYLPDIRLTEETPTVTELFRELDARRFIIRKFIKRLEDKQNGQTDQF